LGAGAAPALAIFRPIVIWYAAIAFFIAAVWIYVALKADG
jgi:hypothetical protein